MSPRLACHLRSIALVFAGVGLLITLPALGALACLRGPSR